jgi:hypothetical protein
MALTVDLVFKALKEIQDASDKIVKEYEDDPDYDIFKHMELINRNQGTHDTLELLYENLKRKILHPSLD